jgi:hypothetical protein
MSTKSQKKNRVSKRVAEACEPKSDDDVDDKVDPAVIPLMALIELDRREYENTVALITALDAKVDRLIELHGGRKKRDRK